MPNLYPTLEDMNVDHMQQAQNSLAPQVAAPAPAAIQYPPPYGAANPTYGTAPAYGAAPSAGASLYPSLDDYMGLDLALVRQTTPQNQQVGFQLINNYSLNLVYSVYMQPCSQMNS